MRKKDNTPLALKVIRWVYPKVERIAPSLAHKFFVNVFFSPLRYKTPDKEKKAESFAQKFSIEVTGKKVQCYSWGSGDKIVLLVHGWAGRATQFRRFIKPLCAVGFRVIGFDGPAHGNSQGKTTSITEFEETLHKIYEKEGEPHAIIAHSFGGGAVLFSGMNGLPIKKLINISSPTIANKILDIYLKSIRGTHRTKIFFNDYIIKTYGKPFDEFTGLYAMKHLPKPIDVLLVHDENDQEAPIEHAFALLEVYPTAKLYKTKGLGHTRILKDDDVIRYCVTYINN